MDKQKEKSGRSLKLHTEQIYKVMMALLSWAAVVLQLYLMISGRQVSLTTALLRFFSFFTILTNLLVALSFSIPLWIPDKAPGKFFRRPAITTAILVYIIVVAAVYNLVLATLWQPEGLQHIVDLLLHSFIPAFMALYWLFFTDKKMLNWKSVFSWLLYPLGYCVMILVLGSYSGFYPYPFVDVLKLGYPAVLLNCLVLAIVFLLLSLLLVGIAKLLTRKGTSQQ